MASRSIAFFLVLVMAICSLLLIINVQAASATTDCKFSNLGCFPSETDVSVKGFHNRKMVVGLKEPKEMVGVQLRRVPSGPDPLHHNGNAPKKPRSDP